MNQSINNEIKSRKQVASAALGSINAEGLNPSVRVQKQLEDFVNGTASLEDIRQDILSNVLTTNQQIVG